jgi:hypothetical protein
MKSINELCSWLAKEEAGKSQIKIGDMRQLIKILSRLVYKNPKILALILGYGKKLNRE